MIDYLRGKLISKNPPKIVIDVNGIGYAVLASMNTFYTLPNDTDAFIALHTHLIIREDAHQLYGFSNDIERSLFLRLIKINGLGPKAALSILSSMTPQTFANHIDANNIQQLTKIPGIGKKTAERLVVELKQDIDQWKGDTPSHTEHSDAFDEAVSALTALGYKASDAEKRITAIYKPALPCETLIRLALQDSGS